MPSLKFNLREAEIGKLNCNRYSFHDPILHKRIHAVYLKATLGWSNLIIGQVVGIHYNVVGEWINAYKRNGFETLLSNKYGSYKSVLENHAKIF